MLRFCRGSAFLRFRRLPWAPSVELASPRLGFLLFLGRPTERRSRGATAHGHLPISASASRWPQSPFVTTAGMSKTPVPAVAILLVAAKPTRSEDHIRHIEAPMMQIRRATNAEITAKMEPYIMALGKVAHSWNYLQETLGQLFCAVTGLEQDNTGQAIWHSTPNDRAQREMLRAAIMASTHKRLTVGLPKAKDDIKWLLDRADSVAEQRNTAIHAPMAVSVGGAEIELFPVIYHGKSYR